MSRKRVVLLGSTGSIGGSTLRVAEQLPERVELVGLSAHSNVRRLVEQVRQTGVGHVAIADRGKEAELRQQLPRGVRVYVGEEGLIELACLEGADVVLAAIVGTGALRPSLAAIEEGKDLAVASKEILVMAGEVVTGAARRRGVGILPVDSEHNAIFQCLDGHRGGVEEVSRLILTASGGPFRQTPAGELGAVTVERALRHPTWEMGRKITIDSATLFNKGLEMIEARWLFGIEMDRIDVVVHPQSIVHSMVEFIDGSVLAQLSRADMGFPIQYALTWPERVAGGLAPLDFAQLARLEFEEPRHAVFPALGLARRAGQVGGTLPAVFNAANEVAVEAFLGGAISFPRIWQLVEEVMDAHEVAAASSLEGVIAADGWARECAERRAGLGS